MLFRKLLPKKQASHESTISKYGKSVIWLFSNLLGKAPFKWLNNRHVSSVNKLLILSGKFSLNEEQFFELHSK